MLKLFIKYQLRNKQAYAFPVMILTFSFIRSMNGGKGNGSFNPYVLCPVYFPYLFTNLIVLSKIPIPLYYITNASMVKVVRAYNLALLCYANITAIAINAYYIFGLQLSPLSCLQNLMIMNIAIFIAFMAGNRMSFSDVYTMKSWSWGSFVMNLLFVVIVVVPSAGLLLLKHWFPLITTYIITFLLPTLIFSWWMDSKSYKEITHFSYLLSLNDNNKKR